jgi:hypothetical protein
VTPASVGSASRRRAPGRVAGALIAVSLGALACAPGSSPSSASSPAVQTAVDTPSPVPSAASTGSPAPGSAAPGPVQDLSLLSILPAKLGAIPVTNEPGSYADALTDPAFVASVAAAAFPIVVDGSDLASGVVARLRTGVYSDAFFRDWRDTYDKGACAQAGGVSGTALAQLGGRSVYITSCAGGLRVYHAYLDARDVLVSIFSVGLRRFGEQLMVGLRP